MGENRLDEQIFFYVPKMFYLDCGDEFRSGHIPGAINQPLSNISQIKIPKDKTLFVYCLCGSRSRRAVGILKRMGYSARSIGGITAYKGEIER